MMLQDTPPSKRVLLPAQYDRRNAILKTLETLRTLFPKTFRKRDIVPLKKGIVTELLAHPDIKTAEISRRKLREAVAWYVGHPVYQFALTKPKAYRVGLDGQPAEEVSEQEVRFARSKKLERLTKSVQPTTEPA
jgi:sRNA-binding protein